MKSNYDEHFFTLASFTRFDILSGQPVPIGAVHRRIAATSVQQRLAKSQLLGQQLSEAGRSLSGELKRRQQMAADGSRTETEIMTKAAPANMMQN